MMVGVVVVAPFFLVLRDDPDSSRLAGAMIVGACVVILAWKFASEEIARKQAGGQPIGRWRKVGVVLHSSAVALVVIGSADIVFLIIYGLLEPVTSDGVLVGFWGLVLGTSAAILLTSQLRRFLPPKGDLPPPSRPPDGLPPEINPDDWTQRPGS